MPTSIITYRGFIWRRALMDLRFQYAGTGFGYVWNLLHPLALIVVYSLIFGVIKGSFSRGMNVPYPVFLCAGLLPWMAFVECVTQGCRSLKVNAPYLGKLNVPEQVFIAQMAVTAMLGLVISFSILLVFALVVGHGPSWHWLLLPLPLMGLLAVGFGFGLGLGTLNVFFPDIGQAVPVILRLAMWMGPVIFPLSFYIEHGLGWMAWVNPATPAISALRALFIDQIVPPTSMWLAMCGWIVGSWLIGGLILQSLRSQIRDEL